MWLILSIRAVFDGIGALGSSDRAEDYEVHRGNTISLLLADPGPCVDLFYVPSDAFTILGCDFCLRSAKIRNGLT